MSQIPAAAVSWVNSGDTGMSSLALWAHMAGAETPRGGWSHPWDTSDFGRCVRLLDRVPEWRARLHEMSARSPYWAALVARWNEVEALYRDDAAAWEAGHLKSGQDTYDLMQAVFAEVRR